MKSEYGLDLNKLKKNFEQYQSKSGGQVFAGGNPNFDESTGTYTNKAQQFKTDYADNLKKYMNIGGNTTTNSNSTSQNDILQNAGNKEDWTTNIGNNNDIKYSNIGNDYSVNIGGIGNGFSNMQGAAAYTALNNNQYQRSKSEINGLKRAAQASEQATGLVGAKDRAANLYNSIGYSQNYWRQKADAQQNCYLGDIFAQQAPDFQMPDAPAQIEDSTEQIMKDGLKEIKGK